MRRTAFFLLVAAICAGCARNIEVEKALTIEDLHTGWYDAGIQPDGKNKLVPSVSFKLQNVTSETVAGVQLNAIFRRVNEPDVAWGEHFVRAIGPDGLSSGSTTGLIVLRSNLGYTGEQARLQLLQNREFVDATVDIFGKQGSRTWVKLGQYKIDRQLLTQ